MRTAIAVGVMVVVTGCASRLPPQNAQPAPPPPARTEPIAEGMFDGKTAADSISIWPMVLGSLAAPVVIAALDDEAPLEPDRVTSKVLIAGLSSGTAALVASLFAPKLSKAQEERLRNDDPAYVQAYRQSYKEQRTRRELVSGLAGAAIGTFVSWAIYNGRVEEESQGVIIRLSLGTR